MTGRLSATVLLVAALTAGSPVAVSGEDTVRFRALEVCVDSAARPLGAWQLEVRVVAGDATIAGVEGGGPGPFDEPPYYDPRALRGGRIVLAAFSTSDDIESGAQRVALLHLVETGPEPEYRIEPVVAGSGDGEPISIVAFLRPLEADGSCARAPSEVARGATARTAGQ